jgi:hypothetical protein
VRPLMASTMAAAMVRSCMEPVHQDRKHLRGPSHRRSRPERRPSATARLAPADNGCGSCRYHPAQMTVREDDGAGAWDAST